MGRFLFVCLLIVAGIFAFGYYRGWFQFTSDSSAGKVHLGLTVDKDKVQEDRKTAVDNVSKLGQSAKEKPAPSNEKVKD